jgi:hypothetical protein
MPKAHAVGLLFLLFAGCQTLQDYLPFGDESTLCAGETIIISMGSGNSLPFGYQSYTTWEFRPTGECRRTEACSWHNGSQPPTKSEWQWESKTAYDRCAKLLRQIRFFEIKERIPDGWCGGTHTSISISCGQRANSVSYLSSTPEPRGIARLAAFLDECGNESAAKANLKNK